MSDIPRTLTSLQAADRVGVHVRVLNELARRGLIPHTETTHGTRRFNADEVAEALADRSSVADVEPTGAEL